MIIKFYTMILLAYFYTFLVKLTFLNIIITEVRL